MLSAYPTSLLCLFFLASLFIIPTHCFTGQLIQISPTQFELRATSAMTIQHTPLSSYLQLTISSVDSANYSAVYSVSSDAKTIHISLTLQTNIVFRQVTLTFSSSDLIIDSSSTALTPTTYTSEIQYFYYITNSVESTVQDYLKYVVWGMLALIGVAIIIAVILRLDTAGLWTLVNTLQLCSLYAMLDVAKTTHLTIFLSNISRLNFFNYVPTYFFQLLQQIFSNLFPQSSDQYSYDPSTIQAPTSPSYLVSAGNALFIILIFTIVSLISLKIKQLQKFINFDSLSRLGDVLLIHFVLISVLSLRYESLYVSIIQIIDRVLSLLTLGIYGFFMIIYPARMVNCAEVIMLHKETFTHLKHYLNQIRVETFFSRNFSIVHNLLRILLAIGIPLGMTSQIAPGIILGVTMVYLIMMAFLSYRYPVFDDRKLNFAAISVNLAYFSLSLCIFLLWALQLFYNSVDRSSSQQLDSAFIAYNRYFSWVMIALILLAVLIALVLLGLHIKEQYFIKLNDKANSMQEELIDPNTTQLNTTYNNPQEQQLAKRKKRQASQSENSEDEISNSITIIAQNDINNSKKNSKVKKKKDQSDGSIGAMIGTQSPDGTAIIEMMQHSSSIARTPSNKKDMQNTLKFTQLRTDSDPQKQKNTGGANQGQFKTVAESFSGALTTTLEQQQKQQQFSSQGLQQNSDLQKPLQTQQQLNSQTYPSPQLPLIHMSQLNEEL